MKRKNQAAFTIVELLVVIVVIGVLASISIVSYSGISQRAKIASLQSDLASASKTLKLFQANDPNSDFPTTIDCGQADSATNKCIRSSSGNTYTYIPYNSTNPKSFVLSASNGLLTYKITSSTSPVAGIVCPTGFIIVPGDPTYSTNDFCVMKYEAKNAGGNIPTSVAAGLPWTNITQTDAITYSQNVAGCSGCHLITEAEWMTLIKNVASVASNWSGGAVGSGYLFNGHNDWDPNGMIAADTTDVNGYYGTNDFSGDGGVTNGYVGNKQRRTFTLNNGEVVWDIAGNAYEWTSGQTDGVTAQQPGVVGNNYGLYIEWNAVTTVGSLPVNPFPSGTGISGAGAWSSTQGIGELMSSATDTALRGMYRGGSYQGGLYAGIFAMTLSAPSSVHVSIGFRVAK